MQPLLLALGVSGLDASDLALRLYRNGVRQSAAEADLTVAEIGVSGDYLVDGLPIPTAGGRTTLTYLHPAGAGAAHRYPELPGAPSNLVLPVRTAGLDAAGLELALYLDGAPAAGVTLTVAELATPGDYRVSGWSLTQAGAWSLRWRDAGASDAVSWSVPAAAAVFVATPEQLSVREDLREDGAPVTLRWDRNRVPASGGPKGADPELIHDFETWALVETVSREVGEGTPSTGRRPATALAQVGDLSLMVPAVDLVVDGAIVHPGTGWVAYLGHTTHPDPDTPGILGYPVLQLLEAQYEGPDVLYFRIAARRSNP